MCGKPDDENEKERARARIDFAIIKCSQSKRLDTICVLMCVCMSFFIALIFVMFQFLLASVPRFNLNLSLNIC